MKAMGKRAKKASGLKVAVSMDMRRKAGRSIVTGIMRYATTRGGVEVQVLGGGSIAEEFRELGDWRPDGVIVQPTKTMEPWALGARAAVLFHSRRRTVGDAVRVGTVVCDNEAAGALAARHLMRHNLRNFAFVGALHAPQWSKQRGGAFAAELARAGFAAPREFSVPRGIALGDEKRLLAEWLEGLPKPCGIFCANDLRAKHVVDLCREGGIAVPELVQVMGMDDEDYICEPCDPSLTSIAPDFEGGGYAAMRMLVAMLSGRPVPGKPVVYGIRGIVERRSTRDDRGTARIVNLALDFIRMHAASGATAAEAVKAAGCSASLLQRYFRKALGRTVVQEIQRVRLEKACRILRHSETPIEEIAPLCGYEDTAFLKVLFRRAYGMSMRQYRRRAHGQE